ncbi:MAG: hypothetical protein JXQ72_10935 [Anaerolineae bacterium]|nr:hypothetical protein [Anaerolineae bacterium]
MREAVDVFWETLRDWWNGMVGLAVMNVIWLALSLTVVLLPPATAAMYAVTNSIAHGTGGRIRDLGEGARRYAWVSYRWALLNVLVGVAFAVAVPFWGSMPGLPGAVGLTGLGLILLLWLIMQFYCWPFLMEQEEQRLFLALRNSLFLALANPIYNAVILSMAVLALLVSVFLPLLVAVFTISFVALLGNRAVVERLRVFGKLPGDVSSSGETSL